MNTDELRRSFGVRDLGKLRYCMQQGPHPLQLGDIGDLVKAATQCPVLTLLQCAAGKRGGVLAYREVETAEGEVSQGRMTV